jgi:glycosyltransferase involved in cell wall biosynthesis
MEISLREAHTFVPSPRRAMKILIIQDFLRSGGTERQSILLANAFAAADHDTRLLTFRPGGAIANTLAASVTHRSLQPFDLRLDWFAPGLVRDVHDFSPDIILCMGRMANCYAGHLQEKFPATPVIGTMRTGKKLPARFRQSLRVVRQVVANSRDARDTLVREHSIPVEKISVIHNSLVFPADAVAATHTTSRRDSFRAQQGASPSTTVLLCVAMFRPEKNQRELIEIAAGLPPTCDWQLWLAGDGPAREACVQLATERNVADRVKFLGFNRDPSPLYESADVAVHASWSEALSNFLIEAQAHGLSAVAYAAQGIEECFIPGETGWAIPRNDRAAFRQALLRLTAEPASSRGTRSSAAREYARATFDPQHQVNRYLDLFSRLTANAIPAP